MYVCVHIRTCIHCIYCTYVRNLDGVVYVMDSLPVNMTCVCSVYVCVHACILQ